MLSEVRMRLSIILLPSLPQRETIEDVEFAVYGLQFLRVWIAEAALPFQSQDDH